ncbi:heavy-metal-associated domain-containing protein [Sediminibacterium soli]|uniref:heavy-metal-associated domain-containing protein n=1 Tax=Sediminibacterium soli TaxID=2698829 RepID=UPI00137A060F|nr:heavy-metal-associated domain-containing protein [Sediminibacterium soli]NCI45991.1 heavy-metal-associated domain-containing protein [Sediminibacterium soli]
MKKYLFLLAVLASVSAGAQITKARLQASGLTCAMCSKAVYKALSSVASVEKVTPDIEGSSYDIRFKKDAEIKLDDLSKAVSDAGFSVSGLQVTAKFQNEKVEPNTHLSIDNQLLHFVNVPAQTLNGEKTVRVVDKNFVSEKEAKKYEKLTALKYYASGTMDGKRVYHVTL